MVDSGLRDGETPLREDGRTEPTIGSSPHRGGAFDPAPAAHVQGSGEGSATAAAKSPLPTSASVLGRAYTDIELATPLPELADLVAHRHTASPLVVGLFGGPGSGRSTALRAVVAAVQARASAAAGVARTPFLSRIHLAAIDAASLADPDPASALLDALRTGLRQPYPHLARALATSGRDPQADLRAANDKLDDAHRRLDGERRTLDEVGSRRARLAETVLFEPSGSRLDAFARAGRGGVERRMESFGIGGDPMRSFKELVQYAAAPGGRLGLAVRAPWAYRGQTKLLLLACLCAGLGLGLGIAIADQDAWLARLRSEPRAGKPLGDWLDAHMGLLSTGQAIAFALAGLALAALAWRAFAFLAPVFKGARLFGGDLTERRRELDGLFAHQTKRVDRLERDVERLTRDAADAEGVAEAAAAARSSDHGGPNGFAMLSAMMGRGSTGSAPPVSPGSGATVTPERIVVALDHLDALPPDRVRAVLDVLHRQGGPHLLVLAALDPARLDVNGRSSADLMRWIDLPIRVDRDGRGSRVMAQALGRAASMPPAPLDATASPLDRPFDAAEADLLGALAAAAGWSPRAAQRFTTAYALARLHPGLHRGALAFTLAVLQDGSAGDRAILREATVAGDPRRTFALPSSLSARWRAAFAAVADADNPFDGAEAAAALRHAARFAYAE